MYVDVMKRVLRALVASAPPAATRSMVGSVPAVVEVDSPEDEFDGRFLDRVPTR
jgi:hypothetical protein